jgi:hypothetical protein
MGSTMSLNACASHAEGIGLRPEFMGTAGFASRWPDAPFSGRSGLLLRLELPLGIGSLTGWASKSERPSPASGRCRGNQNCYQEAKHSYGAGRHLQFSSVVFSGHYELRSHLLRAFSACPIGTFSSRIHEDIVPKPKQSKNPISAPPWLVTCRARGTMQTRTAAF